MKNESKVLTIVIPAYQVEKYIDKTIKSLLQPQILDEIEILVINDGSHDNTELIAKQYEKKYPNSLKVINKENGGHGSTINVGINNATGKYLKVIDGDDWVETDGIIGLVNELKKVNCDMVINPFYKVNNNTGYQELVSYKEIKNNKETLFDSLDSRGMRYYMHSITYKTKILLDNMIHIDENLFYVDMEYILYPIPNIETVLFLDKPVYNYRIFTQEQSMSIENIQKRRNQHKTVLFNAIDYFDTIEGNLSLAKKKYIYQNLSMMAMLHYKVILSLPNRKDSKIELFAFDRELKKKSDVVYKGCFGIKMWALRHFGKAFYFFFVNVVQKEKFF